VNSPAPVITIDGPSGSGKGTVAGLLARELGWKLLDSGALYRAAGLAASRTGIDLDDGDAVAAVARALDLRFAQGRVYLAGEDISDALRLETSGQNASRVAAHPPVRRALNQLQLAFLEAPGLVADGRDMGTVVFPEAVLKVFLTASVQARAERRYKQLIAKGFSATVESLSQDLEARDLRDRTRSVAPLRPAQDARQLDSSDMTVDEVVAQVLDWYRQVQGANKAN